MYKKVTRVFLIILTLQLSLFAREINIDEIINSASKSNKHLFIWLHKTDCGYCENMREFTLENEVIKALIDESFVFVHINSYENDTIKYQGFIGSGLEFAKEIGYNFYPSSLFFNDEGEIVYSEVGYIDSVKNPNERRFYRILNFVKSKSYEQVDFSDYKYQIKKEL